MKAREYLQQVQKLDSMIANKLEEAEYWRSIAKGTTAHSESEKVQTSGNKQKMEDAICKYLQKEDEINADIDKLADIRQEIIETIELLPVSEYNLLYKKYVGKPTKQSDDTLEVIYLTLEEIASDMNKSYRWVTSVHGRALANVQKILNERKENENEQS